MSQLKELNRAIQENSDCYLKLTEAIIHFANQFKRYKAYQKRNPLKGKQIIRILKFR